MQSMFSLHYGNTVRNLMGDTPIEEISAKTHIPVETLKTMTEGWIPENDGVTSCLAASCGKSADPYVRLAVFLKGSYGFKGTGTLTKQGYEELAELESREVERILAM